jgi:hypothetical protein
MSLFSSFFGSQSKTVSEPTNPLDLVTYAAGLASDPSQIDPMLDKVRGVTAKLGPGQQLSAQDAETVIGVYLQIEQYLTTKEPIRNFDKAELRSKIALPLRVQLEKTEATKKGV